MFLPPRIFSFPYLPHIYYVKAIKKIRFPGIYIIFSLFIHSLNPTVNSKTIKVLLKSGKLMRRSPCFFFMVLELTQNSRVGILFLQDKKEG